MKKRPVICKRCEKEIESRADLKVANIKLRPRPFHEKCFNKQLEEKKEQASMFYDALPYNGTYANVLVLLFLFLFTFFMFFYEVPAIVYVVCLVYPLFRLYSWLRIESRLPKTV
ncbi:hypothetical protein [Halalkalibacillus halophilus]|uniref:hypothetical protein n=1 Tax=Halalkalibacillus halophilus TaxID=392827 RepID=UPI00041EA3B6|nr:hypothetical protein [Halalkalibacillus halophilus]